MSETQSTRAVTTGQQASASSQPIREAQVLISISDFEAIGTAELVSLWYEAGCQNIDYLASSGNETVVQVVVEHPLDTGRLSSLGYVDQWEFVSNDVGLRQYVIEVTAPDFPPNLAQQMEGLIGVFHSSMSDRGITITLVGSQQAISDTISTYETVGMSPSLRKLGTYKGHDRPLGTLTERQRDVLETAYEMGYYDVPRTASSEAIAAEMDLTAATVTEHLQRAERNLLAQHLPAQLHSSEHSAETPPFP